MKSDNKMPNVNRDYPESDVSDNRHQGSKQEQQGQSSNNNSQSNKKPVYIKDMPEIKPAVPDQGV